jgi:hypothetical protein
MARINLQKQLVRFAELYIEEVSKRMRMDGTVASEALIDSLTWRLDMDNQISILALRYAGAIELGASPSSKTLTPGRAMVDSIEQWARMKGLRPDRRSKRTGRFLKQTRWSYRTMAFAIARSILMSGTIKRFGYRGTNVFSDTYRDLSDKIGEGILNAYAEDLEDQLRIAIQI